MPVRSQLQIAEQMVAQIRLLEPSVSAEVGTPERLILDTVSGAISEDSIDLVGLQQALNVDTKYGVNLTNFLSIFGFARQEATKATGYVEFTVSSPGTRTVLIPEGTLVKSSEATELEGLVPEFATLASAYIRPGETTTGPVPVECTRPGAFGNVAANKITVFTTPELGPLLGVTAVTNPTPTTHGTEQENDNSLKTRFKNTVFRNMSGTEDQFLALSVATSFTTKANVVGPVSTYQEYVQVPQNEEHPLTGDDTTAIRYGGEGSAAYVGFPAPIVVRGNTVEGSFILTIKDTTGVTPGQAVVVYEEGDNPRPSTTTTVEEVVSTTEIKLAAKAKATVNDGWVTIGTTSDTPYINRWTSGLSTNPYAKEVFPELPVFISTAAAGLGKRFFREGADFVFNFPPKLAGDTYRAMLDGTGNDPRVGEGSKQPNVTFINVYVGSEPPAEVLAPGTVALLEYSYTSRASRNNPEHNVTNAVDVFIDGQNVQQTSTVFTVPLSPTEFAFVDEPVSKFYYENYRRAGEPATRPVEGDILTQLFNQPVLGIPPQITIEEDVFYLGVHYWLVKDVSSLSGTIRARDGIEWSAYINGDKKGALGRPNHGKELAYSGKKFAELEASKAGVPQLIDIETYTYDKNIPDLQVALEGAKQVTTDVLAHSARKRYFKLDITVVYSATASVTAVNENIQKAISRFLSNQYFGAVVRLSDLLQQIHGVAGVENVRWSNDVPHTRDLIRVYETDIEGAPLRGVFTDRIQYGGGGSKAIDTLYVVGNPTEGEFALKYGGAEPSPIVHVASFTAASLETAINGGWLPGGWTATVEEDIRSTVGVLSPIRSFRITYSKTEKLAEPVTIYNPESPLQGGEYVYDFDFYLHDDELPALPTGTQKGDTVPGLIIRARAQNVFEKA